MDNIVSEGLSLMVFGMGFVFVFLTLLVGMTKLMSRLVQRFEPEPVVAAKKSKRKAPKVESQNNDELVAVITAAVHKYRS